MTQPEPSTVLNLHGPVVLRPKPANAQEAQGRPIAPSAIAMPVYSDVARECRTVRGASFSGQGVGLQLFLLCCSERRQL